MANPRNTQDQDQFEETGKQSQRGGVGGKAEDVADEETAEEMSNVAEPESDEHIDDELAEDADDESEGEIGDAETDTGRSSR